MDPVTAVKINELANKRKLNERQQLDLSAKFGAVATAFLFFLIASLLSFSIAGSGFIALALVIPDVFLLRALIKIVKLIRILDEDRKDLSKSIKALKPDPPPPSSGNTDFSGCGGCVLYVSIAIVGLAILIASIRTIASIF